MANSKINNILIPNITTIPSKTSKSNVDNSNKINPGETSEFKSLFNSTLEGAIGEQHSRGIHLSTHAIKRLQERNLTIDKEEYAKLQTAMDRLRLKGGQDSLVITSKAAYIVDVPKNTIVTAIDKDSIGENVFTKIDSTILMN